MKPDTQILHVPGLKRENFMIHQVRGAIYLRPIGLLGNFFSKYRQLQVRYARIPRPYCRPRNRGFMGADTALVTKYVLGSYGPVKRYFIRFRRDAALSLYV